MPILAGVLCSLSVLGAEAAPGKLELKGRVTGARSGFFRVSLFGLERTFEQSLLIAPGQEFHFKPLEQGRYTLEVRRRGIGSMRRTVVVSPSLADTKGVVRVTIPYVPAQAALEGRGMLVSRQQLSVPDKAWNKFQEARLRTSRNEPEKAIEALQKAVEYAPQFSAAWNSLGVIAYHRNDYKLAEEYFRKAAASDPSSFEAEVNLGGVLINRGKLEEALIFCEKAQTDRPQDPLANGQLGLLYFTLGDFDKAEKYLRETERIDPANFILPQLYLARIYTSRSDHQSARRELEDFVKRYPDDQMSQNLRRRLEQNP
jgi:Flp pilus assembly protein TadD